MRIDYLIYFLHIAQSRSMNISAKQLYISQQSLSWAMKALEQEIGAPLLERHYYGVELTSVGEIVAEYAARIVKENYAMQKALLPYLDPVSEAFSGELNLGINYHIINELLYTIVHTFTRQNPGMRLQIRDGSVEWMKQAVADGTLDLALFGEWAGDCPDSLLVTESLYEADILVCVSRRSPLAAKRILDPSELLSEPLIQYTDQSITRSFFAGYGEPSILLETSSTELLRQMIQNGSGYCLTNLLDWQEDYSFAEKNNLVIIPVQHPHAAISYRIAYRRDQQDSPRLAAMLRTIRKRFMMLEVHR